MATTVTRTIGSGGDYATIAAWWAAIPANLLTADEVHIGQLLNQEFTAVPTFSGKTVDATRYIELTAAPGASWTDMPSSPMRYGYGARITIESNFSPAFRPDSGQVFRMSKIQLRNTGTDSGGLDCVNFSGTILLDRVLLEARAVSFSAVASLNNTSVPKQCVFIQTAGTGLAGVVFVRGPMYGCTIALLGGSNAGGIGSDYETNQIVRNCAVFGAAAVFTGSSTYSASGCATNLSSPPAGFTQHAFSTSSGARFGNISLGTHDLRVTAGSTLAGAGVVDATNSPNDAYGTVRGNPPTAGAMDLGAPAPVITGPSGAAGAGSSTANIAELATTGPTFNTNVALGGGYPTLTGTQAANWSITALSATSWRLDPVAPFNFEAGGLVNPQAVVFNASASVSQSCAITVTNVNEAPTFSGPDISVPGLVVGTPMTAINAALLFADPDSGDAGTYSAIGTWPAGVTVSGAGSISGTPSAAATYASLRVRRIDGGGLTADSNLFAITVSASAMPVAFTGTVGAQSGTVGAAFAWAGAALSSFFSGSMSPFTYNVSAGSLPPGLTINASTGVVTGTPSASGSFAATFRAVDTGTNQATSNSVAFTIASAATYSASVGPFGLNTGSGQRASGVAFEAWVFPPGVVVGDASPPAATRVVGTLNSGGLAVLTGLPAAGTGEAWFLFPGDPETLRRDRGTARGIYTAA